MCYSTFVGGDVLGIQKNKRTSQNEISVCHPERSRSFFERIARKNREALSRSGISLEILVACLPDVTFTAESYQESLRDPCGALAPCFRSFALLNPRKFDCAKRERFSPLRMTG